MNEWINKPEIVYNVYKLKQQPNNRQWQYPNRPIRSSRECERSISLEFEIVKIIYMYK